MKRPYHVAGSVDPEPGPLAHMFTPLARSQRTERAEWRLSRLRVHRQRRRAASARKLRFPVAAVAFVVTITGAVVAAETVAARAPRSPCKDELLDRVGTCDDRADLRRDGPYWICVCRRTSGRAGGVCAACCIGCGALYNGDEDFAEPHAPDCSYVEALREVEELKRQLAIAAIAAAINKPPR